MAFKFTWTVFKPDKRTLGLNWEWGGGYNANGICSKCAIYQAFVFGWGNEYDVLYYRNLFYITVNLHDMPLFILEKNDEIISFNARGDELCDPLN